jgi:hypothetical protein
VDTAVEGHTPRLRHTHFDRRLPRAGTLGADIDHEQEPPFPFGAAHRVTAAPRRVEPLASSQEACKRMGGRGLPGTAHAADALRPLGLDLGDPRGEAPHGRRRAQARQTAADGALIVGLQDFLHHPLARGPRLLPAQVLLHPVGDTLLVMQATQDGLGPWPQGSLGWYPIRDEPLGHVRAEAQLASEPATGPWAP